MSTSSPRSRRSLISGRNTSTCADAVMSTQTFTPCCSIRAPSGGDSDEQALYRLSCSFACASVPERRDLSELRLGEQRGNLAQPLRLEAEQGVRAELDRDRAIGVRAQREARDLQSGGLFLDPARVGHDGRGVRLEREELAIRERL